MQNYWPPIQNTSQRTIAGRYRLGQSLGEGGFGEVYQAEDTKYEPPRTVAIKLLHSQYLVDPSVRADIKREASILAQFQHRHIVRVLDFEVTQDLTYIVTEIAVGGSLAHKLRPDPSQPPVLLPLPEILQLFEELAGALDEAHQRGLIHRDIKPANILLDKDGHALLADFGVAMNLGSAELVRADAIGTPEYVAPEVWDDRAGRASDIYALGVLLYQLISGQTPFQAQTNPEFRALHQNEPVPPLSKYLDGYRYPLALDNVIARAMAKNPNERPQTAGELFQAFKAALDNPLFSLGGVLALAREKIPPNVTAALLPKGLVELTRLLGEAEKTGQWGQVVKIGERALKLDGSQKALRISTASACYELGMELLNKGERYRDAGNGDAARENFRLAITKFSRALDLEKDNPNFYFRRGLAYFGRRDFDRATDDFVHAIVLNPQQAFYRSMRAETYYEKGWHDLAIADYNVALQLEPNNKDYYYGRGTIHMVLGHSWRAYQDFENAVRLGHPEAQLALQKNKSLTISLLKFWNWVKNRLF